MAFNCIGVSGCASGSLLAAAVMALSSSAVGMRIVGRLEIFDIVFHLSTIGAAQADDPSHFASVYKCHVVQNFGFRCESNYSRLAVFEPLVNPHQRSFPVELTCHRQRHTMLRLVCCILGGIELDYHGFTVATINEIVKRAAWRFLMGFNVEVTGAARLYRAASVWTAGLAPYAPNTRDENQTEKQNGKPQRNEIFCCGKRLVLLRTLPLSQSRPFGRKYLCR